MKLFFLIQLVVEILDSEHFKLFFFQKKNCEQAFLLEKVLNKFFFIQLCESK